MPTQRRLKLRDVLRDTPVVRVLAIRDFKVKYKQSMLGPLWLVFQPLALLAAFLVAFRGLADVESSGVPYAVFALVGLAVWSFFQAAMTIGTASLITNVNYVRFTPCPRPAFPIAAVIASVPAFGVTAAGALVAAAATGDLSPRVVLLPFGFALAHRPHARDRRDLVVPGGSLPRHAQRAAVPASGGPVLRPDRILAGVAFAHHSHPRRPESPHGRDRGDEVDHVVRVRARRSSRWRSAWWRRCSSRPSAGVCSPAWKRPWRT